MADAVALLVESAAEACTPAEAHRIAREVASLPEDDRLVPLRLGILASASLQFLKPFLTVEALRRGFRLDCYFGGFGQFETELMGHEAPLYAFKPDVLVLSLHPEETAPEARDRFLADGGQRYREVAQEVAERVVTCARRFREVAHRPVLVANHPLSEPGPLGLFDAANPGGYGHVVASANQDLARALATEPAVTVWDYAGLIRHIGAGALDPRLWALGRIPFAASYQAVAAKHLVRTVRGLLLPPAKCLVLDLDNTLWGGVIGDDGMQGIQLGDDFPGNTYKAFQRRVLGLADRGILLALVSKNEFDSVDQVLRHHPDMILRWENVAAHRINWEPKSGNIRAIARELNLGADALVLFDDNPVERAEVQANAPEVGVIEVPADSTRYVAALDACERFDQAALSQEDLSRTVLYRQNRQRHELQTQTSSVEAFLQSLEMKATVGQANEVTLNRIAQLVNKTNQFNLTTRRHSQADINQMNRSPHGIVAWLRLSDRFGDQGLVGVAIATTEGLDATIDTFLMSCRVMSRCVENALLAYLAEEVVQLGCRRLIGEYRPTVKNRVVEDLYPSFGFTPIDTLDDGAHRYSLDLSKGTPAWPQAIARG